MKMELLIKGDEIGYISKEDDQSFGFFCPVVQIYDKAIAVQLIEAWDLRASPASAPEGSFNAWWNSDKLLLNNTYRKDSPAYWAWEGWCAALAAAIDAAMQEDKL